MCIVTRNEAMEILKVGHTKLWEMTRDGKVTPIRRDGRIYFDKNELDAYWEKLRQPEPSTIQPYGTYRKRRMKRV